MQHDRAVREEQRIAAFVEDGAATDVEYLLRADLAGLLPRSVRAQSAWKIPLNVVLSLPRAIDPRFAVR